MGAPLNVLLGARAGPPVQLATGEPSGLIRQFGHAFAGDLRELWRRLVFSVLASNDDDHLRNHGFLMLAAGRWALSPAYDLNPVPEIDRARVGETPISEVFTAVSAWRNTGRRLRFKTFTLDAYASAFEHELMDEARRLLKR